MIHPNAVIHPSAKIADTVEIGPWTVIGADVEIEEHTWIGPHVVISGPCNIGPHNKIFQFSSVGEAPQDKRYKGEETRLEMGGHNVIREFCTIHRGTPTGKGITRIGHHNMLMAYSHIAHDCHIGDNTIFTNNASISGHVTVEDYAIIGAFSGVHQFCTIGAHSFIARASMIPKDVLPYVMISGNDAQVAGLNTEGLKRRGFTPDKILSLRRAYKIIFRQGNTVKQAIAQLQEMVSECPEINHFIDRLANSQRGIVR